MELVRVDTQHAYERIRQWLTTLVLAPGSPIDEQQLAEELDMGPVPVREALKLLAHEKLVVITPRHGLYVADVNVPDLEQLSEMRLMMKLAASFRRRVRERWEGEPEKKNLCYAEFLEADWKTLLKESSEEQIEEELTRILEMPE